MAHALYSIIITPIQIILDFFYLLLFEIMDENKGFAIIGLSFVVSISTLPLYIVAEKWQQVERNTQARLKNDVDRIKTVFKGDEQYMTLTTFYRQNHYHPMMSLRSSVSLLIQIPFFIAAYNFLSNLESIKGYSFWFIKDFSLPDASIKFIGDGALNVLPVAMTLINCVAGTIYTRRFALREKLQVYGMAAIFLVLLYNSPSGLVLYWTMNNIFSLVKNIFYKIKNPRRVLFVLLCAASTGMIFAALFILHSKIALRMIVICFVIMIIAAPFILRATSQFFETHFTMLDENKKLRDIIFVLAAISLALLAGLVIPTTVIESEPVNFCYVDGYKSPFVFVAEPFFQALGFFFLWPLCFYALFSGKTKKMMCVSFPVLLFCACINCFCFSGNYGHLENNLTFMQENDFRVDIVESLTNIFCLVSICAMLIFLFIKKVRIVQSLCFILAISFIIISIKNILSISSDYKKMEEPVVVEKPEPIFNLLKDKRNVILFMLDSSLPAFLPEIFNARPELKNVYEGFIFYPNTVSLGQWTKLGATGIYGGYDYTPYEINLRTDKTLQQKHNEALLTMPVLFSENGFYTTVSNLPYENYLEHPITKMYENYPKIIRKNTYGVYSDSWYIANNMKKYPYISYSIKRNFLWLSFFKISPPMLFRRFIYHDNYWQDYNPNMEIDYFIDHYSTLDYLPELFDCDDKPENENGSFIIINNETIHDYMFLQAPDYVPVNDVTDKGGDKYSYNPLFSTMMGTYLRIGEFFEYLKSQNVYDNTRIIIVSDHGAFVNEPELKYSIGEHAKISSTLLMKDFDAHGEISEDMTFMTNADTPYLITKDIIPNAKNPFTKNPLHVENKADYVKIARSEAESTRIKHNTQFKIKDSDWWTVRDNIFVSENWKHGIPE